MKAQKLGFTYLVNEGEFKHNVNLFPLSILKTVFHNITLFLTKF
jgi:hypothetical protein